MKPSARRWPKTRTTSRRFNSAPRSRPCPSTPSFAITNVGASYSLEIKRSAAKELGDLPGRDCARMTAKIRALAIDPRPHGSEKLAGEDKYRIRQGVYRILYEIDDATY